MERCLERVDPSIGHLAIGVSLGDRLVIELLYRLAGKGTDGYGQEVAEHAAAVVAALIRGLVREFAKLFALLKREEFMTHPTLDKQ